MKAIFMGSKAFGLSVLKSISGIGSGIEWLVLHPDDSHDARSIYPDFQSFCGQKGIDIHLVPSGKETKRIVSEFRPSIVFVCGWYWLLDGAFLSSVPMGVYGIHASILPEYRGGAPLVWAIINGAPEVGATVFKFSEGMDDGDILLQVKVANSREDTIATLMSRIESRILEDLPGYWRQLLSGSARLIAQDHSRATYSGQRIPEDGLIDWKLPAGDVHNFIRAQTSPYPGAFSFINEKKVTILSSVLVDKVYYGVPGQILSREGDCVLVSCGGSTAIAVVDVVVDGVAMKAANAIKSIFLRFSPR